METKTPSLHLGQLPQKFIDLDSPHLLAPPKLPDTNFWSSVDSNFQVDDLLNLPNEEDLAPEVETLPSLDTQNPQSVIESETRAQADDSSKQEPPSGLCVPPDDLVHQLEWLSSFNEDNSYTGDAKLFTVGTVGYSRTSPRIGGCKEIPMVTYKVKDNFHGQSPISVLQESNGHLYANLNHVHRPSRIRKARTGGRVWSLDILKPVSMENRIKASFQNTSLLVTTCSPSYFEPLYSPLQDGFERPYKKAKKLGGASFCSIDSALVRRCSHCLVQKTPQWRAGPLGPKTLCNACGVRYKSGRLVPEYRPAASPSFVNEVHSNSHRRILEMRRVKEMETLVEDKQNKMVRMEKAFVQWPCEESLGSKESPISTENSSCGESCLCVESSVSEVERPSVEGWRNKEGSIAVCHTFCEPETTYKEASMHEEFELKSDSATFACSPICKAESSCHEKLTMRKDPDVLSGSISSEWKTITVLKMQEDKEGKTSTANTDNEEMRGVSMSMKNSKEL